MPGSRIDQLLIATTACLLLALGGIGWLFVQSGSSQNDLATQEQELAAAELEGEPALAGASVAPLEASSVVVDVEGAVQQPGVYELGPGSRVGDAIAAAGGYSGTVDLGAASHQLNLAQVLQDGQKVLVPALSATADQDQPAEPEGGADGLVNLNTATAAELEELPGIGPVTAERIIAAREERPFSSLDELVERDVINRGQLEDIRDLATVS